MATTRARREHPPGLGVTWRRDNWWLQPLAVFLGLSAFGVYSTWAALQGVYYSCSTAQQGLNLTCNYLSPFYSPLLGEWWGLSPAVFILWMPLGFRATCYYYRKAYYRAFFLDPPACNVGEAREHSYCGENAMPLKLQNIHRYFLYLAILVLAFLWKDAYEGFLFRSDSGEMAFGVGIGTIVLLANCVFLSFYTLGCHSLRHLIGGRLDSFHGGSCATRHQCWKGVTKLNEHHQLWAWVSLVVVGFTDFYVRMVAMGVFNDLRLF
ncbi:MAG: succinate dehydrogenase [Acidobacteria bacterium]|nr:succinate dehydrogenase [Acidobacteriota bacterium]